MGPIDTAASTNQSRERIAQPSSSKYKPIDIALLIIVGIGALAVASAGVCAYFHVGALTLSQIQTIILMGAGGGSAFLFLTAAIVIGIKSKRPPETTSIEKQHVKYLEPGLVYGKKAWEDLGFTIDEAPPAPLMNWEEKSPFFPGKSLRETSILIYIPAKVKYKNVEGALDSAFIVNQVKKMGGMEFYFPGGQVGSIPLEKGWMHITKKLCYRGLSCFDQISPLKRSGYRHPTVGEAFVHGLIHHTKSLFDLLNSSSDQVFTFCQDKQRNGDPTAVWFQKDHLSGVEVKNVVGLGGVCPVRRYDSAAGKWEAEKGFFSSLFS